MCGPSFVILKTSQHTVKMDIVHVDKSLYSLSCRVHIHVRLLTVTQTLCVYSGIFTLLFFYLSLSPFDQLEDLMGALEKTRQELDTTKLRLSSTQQSLHERDGHLKNLRQERRKQLEEILEMKLVAQSLVFKHIRIPVSIC